MKRYFNFLVFFIVFISFSLFSNSNKSNEEKEIPLEKLPQKSIITILDYKYQKDMHNLTKILINDILDIKKFILDNNSSLVNEILSYYDFNNSYDFNYILDDLYTTCIYSMYYKIYKKNIKKLFYKAQCGHAYEVESSTECEMLFDFNGELISSNKYCNLL